MDQMCLESPRRNSGANLRFEQFRNNLYASNKHFHLIINFEVLYNIIFIVISVGVNNIEFSFKTSTYISYFIWLFHKVFKWTFIFFLIILLHCDTRLFHVSSTLFPRGQKWVKNHTIFHVTETSKKDLGGTFKRFLPDNT